jgi:hypothetical protein
MRHAAANRNPAVLNFLQHDGLCKLVNPSQLITEIGVERFESLWQLHSGLALRVGGDIADVEVHHLRRFD